MDIGPYRFDLADESGRYAEHHWQMQMSRVENVRGELVAILQVAKDVTEQVLSERLAATRQRTSTAAAHLSYFSYDPVTDRFARGREVDAIFGFSNGEAGDLAAPFFNRIAHEDLPRVKQEIERIFAAQRGEIASFDYRVITGSGESRYVRIRGEVATDPFDRREKLIGSLIDLTDVEIRKQHLETLLVSRNALIEEANHRIKNSLQLSLSFLRLEVRRLRAGGDVTVAKALDAIEAAESRIRSVATLHGMMQLSDATSSVDLDELILNLLQATRASVGLSERALVLTGAPMCRKVKSENVMAIALIVNELLTNAIKYGWDGSLIDQIELHRALDQDKAVITVVNPVVSADNRAAKVVSTGRGADLMDTFITQLGASLTREVHSNLYIARFELPYTQ